MEEQGLIAGLQFAHLASMSNAEVIAEHDALVGDILVDADFFLNELARRRAEAQTRSIIRLTKIIALLTIVIAALTIVNTAFVAWAATK